MISKILLSVFLISFTSVAAINDALKIRISGAGFSDETVVRFLPSATSGFDASYDSWKMFSANNLVPSLFTKIDSVSELSINALPSLVKKTEVDLYTKIQVAGNYVFEGIELGTFSPSVCIYLLDKQTGTSYDLRNPAPFNINLNLSALNDSSRFRIIFSIQSVISVTPPNCPGDLGSAQITRPGESFWEYVLIDSTGMVVETGDALTESMVFSDLLPGLYYAFITPSSGCNESVTFIVNPAPVINADIVISNDSVTVGTPLSFSVPEYESAAYLWDFGDGSTSFLRNEFHTYSTPGNYHATITITKNNCSYINQEEIIVVDNLTSVNSNSVQKTEAWSGHGNIFIAGDYLKASVYDLSGRLIFSAPHAPGEEITKFSFPDNQSMVILILDGVKHSSFKLVR